MVNEDKYEDVEVTRFPLRSGILRISISTYIPTGKKFLNVRVWTKPSENEPAKPTKKGFTILPEQLQDLMGAFEKAWVALQEG
jgi:hypothetical protein